MKKHPSVWYGLMSVIIISLLMSSCVSMKRMKYLQAADNGVLKSEELFQTVENKYKVQPSDNLYIRVNVLDEKTNAIFNSMAGGTTYGQSFSDLSVYLYSYAVSDSGYIDFPVAGKIKVSGLTINQIKDQVQLSVDKYLTDTKIIVRLINFKISVLGEVKNPGQFSIYQDEINIFDLIAQAGDMTTYANRNQVQLIRKTAAGTEIHYLDLTKKDFLNSPYYMLKPNDILYVTPLSSRNFAFDQFPYAIVLSVVSTTLLLLNYFK
ncbi:MAG: polysaccharide biosynthesis/export family protein [Bacteroidales bacterium]